MVQQKEMSSGVEWRIRVGDGSSETLVLEVAGVASRVWLGLKKMIAGFGFTVWRFLEKAWDLGADDHRKMIHCLKVGIALTVVCLFYYMRPLYDGVGGNAMWAIMTVVVVFENTVGATVSKCLNRVFGTFLAGFLAVGVHWVADHSGEKFEPLIIGVSVFLLASAATFSRFIPTVKARFDYGTMIFILTFSLVTVSGFRVDKLFDLAHQRISTIIIGCSLCTFASIFVCPIWAGGELYNLINRHMDKLANSLDVISGYAAEFPTIISGYAAEYYNQSKEEAHKKLVGYKCVLNSKATEESLANWARWEPAHGRFNFRHPWKQYLKIGAAMRSCAYCIEALNGCINSGSQDSKFMKKYLSTSCLKVSSSSSSVIKELANIIKTMTKSSTIDLLVGEMNSAVEDLQNDLTSLSGLFNPPEAETPENDTKPEKTLMSTASIPLMGLISVVTFDCLLMEIASRIEAVVEEVEELANLAGFQCKSKQNQASTKIGPADELNDEDAMKTLEKA